MIIINDNFLLEASVEELARGFVYDEGTRTNHCLICGETYEEGIIYELGDRLYEAKRAVTQHIHNVHGSVFEQLIQLDKKVTGLSDVQRELLQFFKEGRTDKEIVAKTEGGNTSTIRTHRFKLKEKQKQAKVFLAIMSLLKEEKVRDEFVAIHKGAKMVDERYATTTVENEKVLSTYFKKGIDGPLDTFPSKEKRKIIVLKALLTRFSVDRVYTEREVNDILKAAYPDFATLRRYFIEYGFMERSQDCKEYWVTN